MIGAELLARRKMLHLSQTELAQQLGVAANTVARWERGELTIARPLMLRVMLDHLDLKMGEQSNDDRRAYNERIAAEMEANQP